MNTLSVYRGTVLLDTWMIPYGQNLTFDMTDLMGPGTKLQVLLDTERVVRLPQMPSDMDTGQIKVEIAKLVEELARRADDY